jgi:hypothetical protein
MLLCRKYPLYVTVALCSVLGETRPYERTTRRPRSTCEPSRRSISALLGITVDAQLLALAVAPTPIPTVHTAAWSSHTDSALSSIAMSVYVQSVPASPIYSAEPNHYLFHSPPPPPLPSSGARSSHHARQRASKHRFYAELSQCLFDFVIQLLPTREELSIKEDVRRLLERLIRTIEPESRLLSFGSTANGFALKNSGEPLWLVSDQTHDVLIL